MPEYPSYGSRRKSLVLAGGGVRLAYHAGVQVALQEAGIRFAHVDGTSGGIFGAAMVASGVAPLEQAARWRALRLRGFIQMLPPGNYLRQSRMRALGGSRGIRRKIFPALGISAEAIRANTDLETTFNVCNFSRKTLETVDGTRVTTDHLIAGMSLAVFSPATLIDGDWYTDAIWIRDCNLTEAVRRGAREIWLVWCIGNNRAYLNGVFNQYVHMIEISANAGLFQELEMIKALNLQRASGGLEPLTLHIIKPRHALPLDPDFFLNRIDADTLINMGYADAKAYLAAPLPFPFTDIPSASAMSDAGLTVHFRQQFSGTLSCPGKKKHITVRLGIFLHAQQSIAPLECYASLSEDGGPLVSGYQVRVTHGGTGSWEIRFLFLKDGAEQELRLHYRLSGMKAFLWALDARTAQVTLFPGAGSPSWEGKLIQKASCRIKNRLHLHCRGAQGVPRRRKKSRQLLATLFT
jgi:predicted acylesterase/phospholipase RssA